MTSVLLVILAFVFVAGSVVGGSAAWLLLPPVSATRKRLFQATRTDDGDVLLPADLQLLSARQGSISPFWDRVARALPRSAKELERLRQRLVRAGIKRPEAPIIFSVVEMAGPIVLGGFPLLLVHGTIAIVAALAGAALAFFGPGLYVGSRLTARKREIENGLPDALDLIIVCIEAGSGIDQALVKTSEELVIAYPALAEELRAVTTEIRAGKTRLEAFKNLAARTKVDDVRALVAMLVQTDRFGTSIGQALRTHSETSRGKRRQRAEESAQKIGVKLVFPLVLFFFPAFYIVVLGPAVLQFMHEFMHN
jgi:tight adherence protein C